MHGEEVYIYVSWRDMQKMSRMVEGETLMLTNGDAVTLKNGEYEYETYQEFESREYEREPQYNEGRD